MNRALYPIACSVAIVQPSFSMDSDKNQHEKSEFKEKLQFWKMSTIIDPQSNPSDLRLTGKTLYLIPSLSLYDRLVALDLSGNRSLTKIPPEIYKLTQLTSLDLFGCRITEIDDGIGSLTNLEKINLRTNLISQISNDFSKLTKLVNKTLNLACNRLTQVPLAISQMTYLTDLNISNNDLTGLPDYLDNLSNLAHLNISFNKNIKRLPIVVCKLTALKTLIVVECGLISLPEQIIKLTNLQTIIINQEGKNHNFKTMPPVLHDMMATQSLTIDWMSKDTAKTLSEPYIAAIKTGLFAALIKATEQKEPMQKEKWAKKAAIQHEFAIRNGFRPLMHWRNKDLQHLNEMIIIDYLTSYSLDTNQPHPIHFFCATSKQACNQVIHHLAALVLPTCKKGLLFENNYFHLRRFFAFACLGLDPKQILDPKRTTT